MLKTAQQLRSFLLILITTVAQSIQFLRLTLCSRAALSAEVLFLRKQLAFYRKHQKHLALMPEPNGRQTAPGVVRLLSPEVLSATLNTQIFVEEPDTGTGFKLLTKQ